MASSRNRLPREVLLAESASPGTADVVIDRLVTTGVLAISGDCVELRYDALPTSWPRLIDWVESERDVVPRRRRVEEDARVWAARGIALPRRSIAVRGKAAPARYRLEQDRE